MASIVFASLALNLVLVLAFIFNDIRHHRERVDLYSRIMAKSLPEYSATTSAEPKAKKHPKDSSNFLYRSIQQAKQEE